MSVISSPLVIVHSCGNDGPGSNSISSSTVAFGFSIRCSVAAHTSRGSCGGRYDDRPTAMPLAPLTSRLGNAAGSTTGSSVEPS